jgi:hypothetical protein
MCGAALFEGFSFFEKKTLSRRAAGRARMGRGTSRPAAFGLRCAHGGGFEGRLCAALGALAPLGGSGEIRAMLKVFD